MTDATPTRITRRLRIFGRVQGVGYRWHLTQEAARLGVTGWVRNRLDGSVEAVVAGSDAAVAALIAWARRGPPAGLVAEVVVRDGPAETFEGFAQRETV